MFIAYTCTCIYGKYLYMYNFIHKYTYNIVFIDIYIMLIHFVFPRKLARAIITFEVAKNAAVI